MQDREKIYRRRDSRDDPWNWEPTPGPGQPRQEQKARPAGAGQAWPPQGQPGDPSPAPPAAAQKRRHHLRGLLIVLIAALVVGGVGFGAVLLLGDDVPAAGWSFSAGDNYSGDDDFSVNVDPPSSQEDGGEDSGAAQTDDETGPSDIQRYEGEVSFSLELHSAQGLEALSYQEIYARVSPSVVTITVYGDDSGAYATGIILSEDGYILTNQHVVALQSYAQVTTADNQVYEALLVGEDANSDLALLKVEAEGLTPAEFGASDELVVGDECFAIGTPMGINYRGSFSNGIVSALNRSVTVNGYSMSLIQTTAALNSGNSGGPLINIYGQVIGINNMKIMSSETTVEGLGFAIPTTTAQRVVNALAAYGEVEHPVMGITCYAVTAGDQDGNEISGIYVATVSPASDAWAQGLTPGDIITAVNGQSVYQVSDVNLTGMAVGDSITVTVYRNGETFDLTFQLMEQNDLP